MIERYLFDQLLRYLSVFPVVLLIGPRRVGKTVLARNAIKWFGRQSIYLDLEFGPEFIRLQNTKTLFDEHASHCIVLDEVQRKQDIFESIRDSTEDHGGTGKFLLITSSPSSSLQKKLEVLTGKIGYIIIHPLDRLEVFDDPNLDTHWIKGGFPEAYYAIDNRQSFIWRDNLIRTYCERDLPLMGLIVKPDVIRKFLNMLASDQGGIWNASNFARSMGLTSPTVTRYLRFLEDAFLITVLNPFKIDSGKRLVSAPKIYIADSGILHTLLHIETEEELRNHIIFGKSWEGYVVAQIQSVIVRKAKMFFYKTHQGAQVDLLIVQNDKPIFSMEIQTSDDPKNNKGFRNAIKDLKTESNYIVTPASANYQLTSNIHVINLDDLLMMLRDRFFHKNQDSRQVSGTHFELL
jgi:predicted AAA+ superfamily ATPase